MFNIHDVSETDKTRQGGACSAQTLTAAAGDEDSDTDTASRCRQRE
ncbi:MAG: hypothetical protein LBH00_00720 [Planctomycetaceae bacterium]|nr:hypothetical protein [Planctomycetaceae bacterium]